MMQPALRIAAEPAAELEKVEAHIKYAAAGKLGAGIARCAPHLGAEVQANGVYPRGALFARPVRRAA